MNFFELPPLIFDLRGGEFFGEKFTPPNLKLRGGELNFHPEFWPIFGQFLENSLPKTPKIAKIFGLPPPNFSLRGGGEFSPPPEIGKKSILFFSPPPTPPEKMGLVLLCVDVLVCWCVG